MTEKDSFAITTNSETFRSGFSAIVGKPNAGKSTLFNSLLNEKIAIITAKPQTTRFKIRGIVTLDDGQMIFIDTPGFFKPRDLLGRYMLDSINQALDEVDVISFVFDVSKAIDDLDCYIAEEIFKLKTPVVAVLNKIDQVSDDELDAQEHVIRELGDFAAIVRISATEKKNLAVFVRTMLSFMPLGPKYYPDDMHVDHPEKMIFAELIREKAVEYTKDEIPYAVFVEVTDIEERKKKNMVYVKASIFVERDSQKGILIGEGGEMLKKIGSAARNDVEKLLGTKIFLDLTVKVKKNWRKDDNFLSRYDF